MVTWKLLKGIFELLDAFYEINKKHANTKLMIVGEGHEEQKVRETVSKLNFEDSIIFTGKDISRNHTKLLSNG